MKFLVKEKQHDRGWYRTPTSQPEVHLRSLHFERRTCTKPQLGITTYGRRSQGPLSTNEMHARTAWTYARTPRVQAHALMMPARTKPQLCISD